MGDNIQIDPATTVVTTARLVAHRRRLSDGTSENHWSIFLLFTLGDIEASLRMNMQAVPGNTTGTLIYSVHNYTRSNSAVKYWDFGLAPGVTIQMVQTLLNQKGRHQYLFSGGGSGCRFWW
jgi:hypothetical protein